MRRGGQQRERQVKERERKGRKGRQDKREQDHVVRLRSIEKCKTKALKLIPQRVQNQALRLENEALRLPKPPQETFGTAQGPLRVAWGWFLGVPGSFWGAWGFVFYVFSLFSCSQEASEAKMVTYSKMTYSTALLLWF